MPRFRCYIRSSQVVEAETAEDALDAYQQLHANYGFRWLDYTGVEECDQNEEPDMVAGEEDCDQSEEPDMIAGEED